MAGGRRQRVETGVPEPTTLVCPSQVVTAAGPMVALVGQIAKCDLICDLARLGMLLEHDRRVETSGSCLAQVNLTAR
jgi:hypothetical protein